MNRISPEAEERNEMQIKTNDTFGDDAEKFTKFEAERIAKFISFQEKPT